MQPAHAPNYPARHSPALCTLRTPLAGRQQPCQRGQRPRPLTATLPSACRAPGAQLSCCTSLPHCLNHHCCSVMMAQAEGRSRPSSSCGWEEEPCEGLQALQSSLGGDTGEAAVSAQTQTAECTDAAVQCEPPPLPPADDLRAALAAPQLARFLANAVPRCEEALQQNELADVLADELAALVDEEAGELGAGAGGAAAASGSGSRTSGLVEHHSFSDLLHSKGRTLEAVQFHPSRRGVAAVACAQGTKGAVAALGTGQPQGSAGSSSAGSGQGHTQASSQLQKPHTGCILVWSHADAMHPEAVLQAPADVFAFAFHPTQPHWLAAGLATGQVALFNLQQQPGAPAAGSAANTGAAAERGGLRTESFAANRDGASDTTAEGGGKAAVLLPLFLSLPNASHQAAVTDLQWMPGAAVGQDGRLEAVGAGAAASPREGATSSSALTAAPAATDSCNLFATTAADGSILMWDMRIRARHQRKAAGAKGKCFGGGELLQLDKGQPCRAQTAFGTQLPQCI